jgi:predicted ATPase/DNA-binding winged helix-turn-helix (wHTH) protein
MKPREELLRFGKFLLSPSRRELICDGTVVEIGARAFDLLATLARRSGESVSKKTLTDAAWGGRTVETNNLTVQIAALRRLLADHAAGRDGTAPGDESFIRTLPGYGYLFVPEVVREVNLADAGPAEPFTLFVGRKPEISALTALLRTQRLVSLIGIGGVGKTRLALRVRRDLVSDYPDGITFLDLAPLTDPARVTEAAAVACGASGGASAEMALVAVLRARRLLLIVDNAEHMIAPVRALVSLILGQCSGVTVLVTSRESLGLPGETIFRLQPLALPAECGEAYPGPLSATAALGYDAVQLFVDRARALLPGFVLVDETARDAVAICRRLDGIALAIEMAVPLLEVLTPRQLAERLHDRFAAIAGSRQSRPARQRTLRAMLDWSWELLDSRERMLLQYLAMFAGGATLDSVTWLTGSRGQRHRESEWSTLRLLLALLQKSLVGLKEPAEPLPELGPGAVGRQAPNNDAAPRYQLLETTRQYALERLRTAQRVALARKHAMHIAELFEQAEAHWPTMHGAVWLDRYGVEADNLRAAMRWAFNTPGETDLALRLMAGSISLWWELPGLPLRESRRWYDLAIARISAATPAATEARLWLGQSWIDSLDGDVENFAAAARAISLFRGAGDAIGLGAALWRAASTVSFRDHEPDASALLAEALAVLTPHRTTKWWALCHIRQADLMQHRGELPPALARYDAALAMVRSMGHGYGLMVCGGNRAYLLFQLGRHEEAIAEMRSLRRELPSGLRGPLVSKLAVMLAATGEVEAAREAIRDSLAAMPTTGMLATLGRTLEALALLLARSGACEPAARLLGFILTLHPPDRVRLSARLDVYRQLDARLKAALSDARRAHLLAEGAGWTEAEATAVARQFCCECGDVPHH